MHHAVLKNAHMRDDRRLASNIAGDTLQRFRDGEYVITSRIEDDLGGGLYKTHSGTIYKVESAWPMAGDKMRFLGKNGYDHQLAEASKLLSVGDVLTVKRCYVGSFDHSIEFEEMTGRSFNGVMFERVPA